jgi:hypothetical protein
MTRNRCLGLGLAFLLGAQSAARAQTPAPTGDAATNSTGRPTLSLVPVDAAAKTRGAAEKTTGAQPPAQKDAAPDKTAPAPAPMESADGGSCAADDAKWGPSLPQDVKFLQNLVGCDSLRLYGWADAGYTYNSHGHQLMDVEPRENRFGNEMLVNQLAIVLEKPLKSDELSWGFNATFYAGADAALLRPEGGFTTTNPRFGADFRNLYLSAHLPVLGEGGVDVKVGRMGTIIGWESALAPYRPFYSNDYQWFYGEDGAFTGALATWHATKQLDITNGITMGANTFFTMRGDSPCYIGQINYWLQEDKRTMISTSVYVGNQAIFSATPPGDTTVTWELMIVQNWNKYLTQVVQSDNGWENHIPGVGTGQWWSAYNIFVLHVAPKLDVTNRVEWFNDVNSTRVGTPAHNYGEVTGGLDYHPRPWIRLRPEVRGDFADQPAFNHGNSRNQFTAAMDILLQF